jgi:hypothetical protein
MAGNLRPVSGEYGAAVGVELHLSDGGHPGALQAELDATDAGEQGQNVEAHRRPRIGTTTASAS